LEREDEPLQQNKQLLKQLFLPERYNQLIFSKIFAIKFNQWYNIAGKAGNSIRFNIQFAVAKFSMFL
jgi:hypothetical protein